MSSDKTRYDFMIPFFGLENDLRVRLYLHLLEEYYKSNGNKFDPTYVFGKDKSGAKITDITIYHTDDNYRRQFPDAADEDISEDWYKFGTSLVKRLSTIDATDSNVLNVIKTIGNKSSDPNYKFFCDVIILHVDTIHSNIMNFGADGNNITSRKYMWSNADSVSFKVFNNTNTNTLLSLIYKHDLALTNKSLDDELYFHYNLYKYLSFLLEKQATNAIDASSSFWDNTQSVGPIENEFKRNPEDTKKIGKYDSNNNFVDYSRGSKKYRDDGAKTCSSFGVKENPTDIKSTCADYITKCVVSGSKYDIAQCKEFMLSNDFWNDIKTEINNMVPSKMTDTLDMFNFQKVVVDKNIIMYQSVDSWMNILKAKIGNGLTDIEFKNIMDNTKLKSYLNAMVNKVNRNPAILNQNLTQQRDKTNWSTILGLKNRVTRNKQIDDYEFNVNNFTREFSGYRNDLLDLQLVAQRRINKVPGGFLFNGVMFGGNNMVGGAMAVISPAINGDIKPRKQGVLIENMANTLVNKIESMGKQLSQADRTKLFDYINSYKDLENKLVKAIVYADKYIDLTRIAGDSTVEINFDHIQAFVDARNKYFTKTINSQTNILDSFEYIINSALNTVNDPKQTKQSGSFTPNV